MHIEPFNRAISFFEKMGDRIPRPFDGIHVRVNGHDYSLGDLPALAKRLHPEEWIAAENAYVAGIVGKVI